jgi:hypothetical protein
MFRGSAEKAGIVFVDLWDGFVKENGRYTSFGPDYAGQTRRLRTADGVYFTKPGARKLAFYVEREISRVIANRAKLVALPANPEDVTPEHPGGSAPRPLAGPVLPLTASYGMPDKNLLGGAARPRSPQSIATRVLKRGEALSAPRGRADYFVRPGIQRPAVADDDKAGDSTAGTDSGTSQKTMPGASMAAPPRNADAGDAAANGG